MSDIFENKGAMTATIVVAASNSLNQAAANYVCDGVNDEVEIQAALDALPTTGGEVLLLDGTYNCETTINLDSNQTLRGCGRNTILITSIADLVFLSAVGASGTELTGIIIADLQIDGGDGAVSDCGIYFEYVDYSLIQNVYSRRHASGTGSYLMGIFLINSDFNQLVDNVCQDNAFVGIYLSDSNNNIISGNTCQGNAYNGICLSDSNNNIVSGNTCQGNGGNGVYLTASSNNIVLGNTCQGNVYDGIYSEDSLYNSILDNTCQGNGEYGIDLISSSNNNIIMGNFCLENSQENTNTYDDIYLASSDHNNIQGNTCRAGGLDNMPRYGINIANDTCDGNIVIDNDLYNDGFGTAPFNDAGTGTKLNTYCVPLVDGSDPQDSGYLIDANTEYARSYLRLPDKVVQVVRMKVYARSVVAEGDKMRGEFVIYGAADNEGYQTHNGSVANHPSASSNFAANDVVFWTITTAGVLALLGGDSVEVKVLHEAAGGADCATNAYFRTVEIEYV